MPNDDATTKLTPDQAAKLGPLADVTSAKLATDAATKAPIVHLLKADGSQVEFRRVAIALEDSRNEPTKSGNEGVYCLLINGDGTPYQDHEGNPVMLEALPLVFYKDRNPDDFVSMEELAQIRGTSLSTIKRAIQDGSFPKPEHVSPRRVAWRWGDVQLAAARGAVGKRGGK